MYCEAVTVIGMSSASQSFFRQKVHSLLNLKKKK